MLSAPEAALLFAGVFVAAVLYGSLGLGFAFIVVPMFTLIVPTAMPATVWLLTLPFGVLMIVREREHVDISAARWMVAGRLAGTPLGVLLLVVISPSLLTVVFGILLCVAAALAALAPRVPPRRRVRAVAGLASGIMGTAAALGGPALALGYHDRSAAEVRATLATCFVIGDGVSLAAVAAVGETHWWQFGLAAALMPAMLGGFGLSTVATRVLEPGWVRPGILVFALVCGVTTVAKAIT